MKKNLLYVFVTLFLGFNSAQSMDPKINIPKPTLPNLQNILNLARAQVQNKDFKNAEYWLKYLMQQNVDQKIGIEAKIVLTDIYSEKKQYKRVEKVLTQLEQSKIIHNYNDLKVEVWLYLGVLYVEWGYYKKAIPWLQKAALNNIVRSVQLAAWLMLGLAHQRLQNYTEAERWFVYLANQNEDSDYRREAIDSLRQIQLEKQQQVSAFHQQQKK